MGPLKLGAAFFLIPLVSACGNPLGGSSSSDGNFHPGYTYVCPVKTYAQEVLADNAVAYWRLDDSSATAFDYTYRGNNGTYSGGVTLGVTGIITGDNDKAASFAAGKFVRIPVKADVDNGTIKTVVAWTKTASANAVVFSAGDTNINTYQIWITPAGKASLWSNGGQLDGIVVNNNQWHQLAAVWNGVTASIYVDRALKNSGARIIPGTAGFENQIGTQCTGLGSTVCNSYVTGTIDDVSVYNSALPASRIQTLYNAAAVAPCTLSNFITGPRLIYASNLRARAVYKLFSLGME